MFGGSRNAARQGALSVIGTDVTVRGDILAEGDVHVDGTVEGDIACGSLIQGAKGRIVGSVTAQTVRLAGTVEGLVTADTLNVERTARLHGDAAYRALSIETGAQVDGRMHHRASEDAQEPPLRLVDASDG